MGGEGATNLELGAEGAGEIHANKFPHAKCAASLLLEDEAAAVSDSSHTAGHADFRPLSTYFPPLSIHHTYAQ